ncbi:hypothetical protein KAJ27_13135 [bacterium]|nr:hypothetical protein [bacterium]
MKSLQIFTVFLIFLMLFSSSTVLLSQNLSPADQINQILNQNKTDFKRIADILDNKNPEINKFLKLVTKNKGDIQQIINIIHSKRPAIGQISTVYKKHESEIKRIGKLFLADKKGVNEIKDMFKKKKFDFKKIISFVKNNPAISEAKKFLKTNKSDVDIVKNIFKQNKTELKQIAGILAKNKSDYIEMIKIAIDNEKEIREVIELVEKNDQAIKDIKAIIKNNNMSTTDILKISLKNPEFKTIAKVALSNITEIKDIAKLVVDNKGKFKDIANAANNPASAIAGGSTPGSISNTSGSTGVGTQSSSSKILNTISDIGGKLKSFFKSSTAKNTNTTSIGPGGQPVPLPNSSGTSSQKAISGNANISVGMQNAMKDLATMVENTADKLIGKVKDIKNEASYQVDSQGGKIYIPGQNGENTISIGLRDIEKELDKLLVQVDTSSLKQLFQSNDGKAAARVSNAIQALENQLNDLVSKGDQSKIQPLIEKIEKLKEKIGR